MADSLPTSAFGSGPVAAAAQGALASARAQLGVRRTALFWLDDALGQLSCVTTAGAGGPDGWVGQRLGAGVGMAGRAVREGRTVWTPDLLADARVPISPWLRERLEREGLGAVAATPVRMDGVVRGALGFLDDPGRTFDDSDLHRIAVAADEVARGLGGAPAA